MRPLDFRVGLGGPAGAVTVAARFYPADLPVAWLVLAPGAGAGHDHPFVATFARGLSARGLNVVTFNFPYADRGRRVPDPNATLEACWEAVLRDVRERAGRDARLFAGGKSMGGRIASQVAAKMVKAQGPGPAPRLDGLVLLGYPLHPPGRPDQPRTAHWPDVRLPALFVQGSRDPFASPDELREALARFGGEARLRVVDDGDHSFKVRQRANRDQDAVYEQVQAWVAEWVAGLTN